MDKKNNLELEAEIEEPQKDELYRHFKGRNKLYAIQSVSRDHDNPESKFVNYSQLHDNKFPNGTIWTRSLENFCGYKIIEEDCEYEGIEYKKGEKVKRFERN